MKFLPPLLLALACTSAVCGQEKDSGPAPQVKAFLAQWAASMKDVRSLRVEFTQTKKLRILRRPRISKGFTLMKDKKVLMVVQGKDGQRETELLVADGKASMHYPRQKRVEVFPVGAQEKGPKTPFLIFGGDLEALPEDHHVTLTKDGEVDVLTLVPKVADGPITKTVMRFKDYTVVGMEQHTRRGDELTLEVSVFERNPELSDDELKLTLTKDTQVVKVAD